MKAWDRWCAVCREHFVEICVLALILNRWLQAVIGS